NDPLRDSAAIAVGGIEIIDAGIPGAVHYGEGCPLVLSLPEQLRRRADAAKSPAAQPQDRDPHPGPPEQPVVHSLRRDGKALCRCYHRQHDMSVEQRARLRHQTEIAGLPVEGGTLQWLIDGDLGAEHVMAYRLVLEPDSALSHVHAGAEEVLYVLEGTGEARIEGATHHVGPGQAVFIPDGAEHTYINTGQTQLIVVGALAPPIDLGDIHAAMPRLDLSG